MNRAQAHYKQRKTTVVFTRNRGFPLFIGSLSSMGGTSGGARPKIMTKINDEDWIIKISSYTDGKMWKRWNTTILYVQKKWH